MDSYATNVEAAPEDAFRAVEAIGGTTGWYAADWLWWLRGLLDRLLGGPGRPGGWRSPCGRGRGRRRRRGGRRKGGGCRR
ncbi:MAG: DUF2867 domain-containing protein [Planctomycetota bacterium]